MYYKVISWDEAKELINSEASILIDVRDKEEYDKGHVKGAVYVNLDKVVQFVSTFNKDYIFILYCEKGGRSMLAARSIEKEFGDKYKIYVIRGGISNYKGKIITYIDKQDTSI